VRKRKRDKRKEKKRCCTQVPSPPRLTPHYMAHLKLNTTCGTECLLDVRVDSELESGQGTDHEETRSDTGVGSPKAELLSDLDEAGSSSLSGSTRGLVDLGQHGVGGLRDEGGGKPGDQTSAQVGDSLHGGRQALLGEDVVDRLGGPLVDYELGHGVGNLLEQDGSESGVEGTDTLVLEDLSESTDESGGELGLGDETDTGGLERAESDVGEELGKRGRGEVDGSAVLLCGFITLCASLDPSYLPVDRWCIPRG